MVLPSDMKDHPMTDNDVCAPVGKLEMADMFGVKHATVHQWRYRTNEAIRENRSLTVCLPPPDFPSVNGSEAWNRSTLLVWGLRRGKNLSDSDRAEAQRLIDAEDDD